MNAAIDVVKPQANRQSRRAAKNGPVEVKVSKGFDVSKFAKSCALKMIVGAQTASKIALETIADAVAKVPGDSHKSFLEEFRNNLGPKGDRACDTRKTEVKACLDAAAVAGVERVSVVLTAGEGYHETIKAIRSMRDAWKASAEKALDAVADKEYESLAEMAKELDAVTTEGKGEEGPKATKAMKDEVLVKWIDGNVKRLSVAQCDALIEAVQAQRNILQPPKPKKEKKGQAVKPEAVQQ